MLPMAAPTAVPAPGAPAIPASTPISPTPSGPLDDVGKEWDLMISFKK